MSTFPVAPSHEVVSDLARSADAALRYVSARVLTRLLAGVATAAASRDAGVASGELSVPAIEVPAPWAAAIGDLGRPQPAYAIPSRFGSALSRALLQSAASEDLLFFSMLASHLEARADLLRWIVLDTRSLAREAAGSGKPLVALDTPPRARAGLMGDPVVSMTAKDALYGLAVSGSNRVPVESVLSLLAARHAVVGSLDLLHLGDLLGLSWPSAAPSETSLLAAADGYLHMAAATVRDGGLSDAAGALADAAARLSAAVEAMPDLPETDPAMVPVGGTDLMQGAPVSAVLRSASAAMRRGGAGRGLLGYRGLGPDGPVEVPVVDGWGQPLGLLPSAFFSHPAPDAGTYDTPAARPGAAGAGDTRASAARTALPTVPFDVLRLAWPVVLGDDKSRARDKLAQAARGSMMSVPLAPDWSAEKGAPWPRPVKAPPQDALTRDGRLLVGPADLMASLPAPLAVAWLATARPSTELLSAVHGGSVPDGSEGALGLLAWLAMVAHEHDRWLLAGLPPEHYTALLAVAGAGAGAGAGADAPDEPRGLAADVVARSLRLMAMPGKGGEDWLPSVHTATAMLPWSTRAALRAALSTDLVGAAVKEAGLPAIDRAAPLDETAPPEGDDYGGVGWRAPAVLVEAVARVPAGWRPDDGEPVDKRALSLAASLSGAVHAARAASPAVGQGDSDNGDGDGATGALPDAPVWAWRGGWTLNTTHAAATTLGRLLPAANAGGVADAMAGWLVEAAVRRMALLGACGLIGDDV